MKMRSASPVIDRPRGGSLWGRPCELIPDSAPPLFLLLGAGPVAAEDHSEPVKLRLELPLSALDLTSPAPRQPGRGLPRKDPVKTASMEPDSRLASFACGALRWAATIGALLVAGELGAHTVGPDSRAILTQPGELPSTLHP